MVALRASRLVCPAPEDICRATADSSVADDDRVSTPFVISPNIFLRLDAMLFKAAANVPISSFC